MPGAHAEHAEQSAAQLLPRQATPFEQHSPGFGGHAGQLTPVHASAGASAAASAATSAATSAPSPSPSLAEVASAAPTA